MKRRQRSRARQRTFAEAAKTAEDFGALATEQGVEASTITFDKDSSTPSADLIAAADKLGEGEVTEMIEAENGCYIGKVTSLFDREATDTKKQSIVNDRKTDLYTKTCEKWLKKADIKVNKSVWKKVDLMI